MICNKYLMLDSSKLVPNPLVMKSKYFKDLENSTIDNIQPTNMLETVVFLGDNSSVNSLFSQHTKLIKKL
jgi:hypothetical protein